MRPSVFICLTTLAELLLLGCWMKTTRRLVFVNKNDAATCLFAYKVGKGDQTRGGHLRHMWRRILMAGVDSRTVYL